MRPVTRDVGGHGWTAYPEPGENPQYQTDSTHHPTPIHHRGRRLFYEEAKRALEQVKYAFSRVEASNPEPSGLLRITAPMTLGVSLVGPLVSAFMQCYPQIQVELILSNEVVDLYETSFDLAFRISELIGVNLLAKPLPPYRMVICASPRYLENGRNLSPPKTCTDTESSPTRPGTTVLPGL